MRLPPFAQQRTPVPKLQQGPRTVAEHTIPRAQPAMLSHWKVAGQAGTAGESTKVI
jgi:hypothetical protein